MPDASSLVTPADYAWITLDTTSTTPAVTGALSDALGLVQDYTGRQLVHGTYTETLRIYRNSCVYPTATPIDSVSSPNVDLVSIQGAGVFIGYFDPTPVVNYGDWGAAIPPQAKITYVGGYTDATLPMKLKRALCRIAYNILHPAVLTGVPGGVNSVHVGDVGYAAAGSQPLRTMDPLDDGVRADLKGYRHPQVLGWQT